MYGYTLCILTEYFSPLKNSQIIFKSLDDMKPKTPSQQLTVLYFSVNFRDVVNGHITGLGERKQICISVFPNLGS